MKLLEFSGSRGTCVCRGASVLGSDVMIRTAWLFMGLFKEEAK